MELLNAASSRAKNGNKFEAQLLFSHILMLSHYVQQGFFFHRADGALGFSRTESATCIRVCYKVLR